MEASTAPLLSLRRVSKVFGGVEALVEVDLEVRAGEVVALVGDNAQHQQAGDRALASGPGGSEDLCVAMTLPLATTSAFASASANVKLTFDAEQVTNN